MLPGHLIAEFWLTVERQLEKDHRLSKRQAQVGITDYRKRLDFHRVEEMVYHNNPEDVSKTIAGILRQGGFDVLDPLPSTDPGATRTAI